jgi:riboflavin synthase
MFGGLVETTGEITQIDTVDGCKTFTIASALPFTDVVIGDSIAVNGVCLTVTTISSQTFQVTAVPETLRLTNLNDLTVKQAVNLERSLKADARIGGHNVQGHVDTTGQVIALSHDSKSNALIVKIEIDPTWSKYMVNKGYITLDGMSITIIESTPTWFTITLIPHTQAVTIAKNYHIGSRINIEVDILGKYIEKLIGAQANVIPH